MCNVLISNNNLPILCLHLGISNSQIVVCVDNARIYSVVNLICVELSMKGRKINLPELICKAYALNIGKCK